jgi:hypothetical protein
MEYPYDSGGKHQDDKKFKENYAKIFGKPCPECKGENGKHKMDCSMNWRKKPV